MLLAPSTQLRRQSPTIPASHQHNSSPFSYSDVALLPSNSQNWYPSFSAPNTPVQTSYDLEDTISAYALPFNVDPNTSFRYHEQSTGFNKQIANHNNTIQDLRVQLDQGLMQTDHSTPQSSWHFTNGQLTPTSVRNHHRESSLSSLGSAGPASPYNQTTSHPQVLLPSDSVGEVYYDGLPSADQAFHTFSKQPLHSSSQDSYLPTNFHNNYNLHPYNSAVNYNQMMVTQKQSASGEDETMSAPDYGHSGRPSVASTHHSPATPSISDDFDESHRKIDYRNTAAIPKLDRTMSDAYNDELYSPSFSFTSAPQQNDTTMLSPSQRSDIFSQRLQTATSQHLSASAQASISAQSRGHSPFRQGSPLAPTAMHSFSQPSPQVRLGSAAQIRQQQKLENDARALKEQIKRSSPEQSTPKTISPKDAVIEYRETEEDAAMPLFPPQPAPRYRMQNPVPQDVQPDFEDSMSQQSFNSMATSRRQSSSAYSSSSQPPQHRGSGFNFAPPSVPGGIQVPQQYPFVPQNRHQNGSISNVTDRTPDFPSTLTSMESSSTEYAGDGSEIKKPAGTSADSGTYTCTYHGCNLRFETPAKLQKHKREGHRQSVPLIGGADGSGMTSAALLRNSQAGPHKCERINPSTGKPCNTIFSRPYDLTRHEDTIHNARKQKVRCQLCTEEKTFSRNDALTRHMRVVHPEVDFPGKIRRRA